MAPARPRASVVYQVSETGPPLVLLHATLSSSRQLRPLADQLAVRFSVLGIDRRGSGAGAGLGREPAAAVDVAVHVDDLVAILDTMQLGPCIVVGHSYGGCLGLELAARHPERARSVWAYEPPYAPLAPPDVRERLAEVGRRTREAGEQGDGAAAAEAFFESVAGPGALATLSPVARERIRSQGGAAIAESTLRGLEASGLAGISCPVRIATGTSSAPWYVPIADALVERIPGAVHERIERADHGAPLTDPAAIAASIMGFAAP